MPAEGAVHCIDVEVLSALLLWVTPDYRNQRDSFNFTQCVLGKGGGLTEVGEQELRRVSGAFAAKVPSVLVSSTIRRHWTKNPRNISPLLPLRVTVCVCVCVCVG